MSVQGESSRTARIEVRLTEAEKASLQQAADEAEAGLSEYVRGRIFRESRHRTGIKLESAARPRKHRAPEGVNRKDWIQKRTKLLIDRRTPPVDAIRQAEREWDER